MKRLQFLKLILASLFLMGAVQLMKPKNPDYLMFEFDPAATYDEEWKKVDSLQGKGLYASANELVEQILAKARAEKEAAQIVKCTLYRIKFAQYTGDEDYIVPVRILKEELKVSSFPEKPVLESMLASAYLSYYRSYSWQIMSRSQNAGADDDDFQTWDPATFARVIREHALNSLVPRDSLIKMPLGQFDAALLTQTYSKQYRPTLYDALAHRAIDILNDDLISVHRAAYRFYLDMPEAFADPATFEGYTFDTPDSNSYQLAAYLILQDLSRFHRRAGNQDALGDLTRKRISMALNHSILPNKDELYFQALVRFEKQWAGSDYGAQFGFDIANYYLSESSKYNEAEGKEFKSMRKKAVQKAEEVIRAHPGSMGAHNAAVLIKQIRRSTFSLNMEQVNYPGKPILGQVHFTNTNRIWLRLYKLEHKELKDFLELNSEDRHKRLMSIKPMRAWEQALPDDGDHNNYSAEMAMESLEPGEYVLLGSDGKDFGFEKQFNSYGMFVVSSMGFGMHISENGEQQIYVTDRISGRPLNGVDVTVTELKYDYKKYRYVPGRKFNGKTNENGIYEPGGKISQNGTYYTIDLVKGKDYLFPPDQWYLYHYDRRPDTREYMNTMFFSDRSIYRPGQKIYYKGIALTRKLQVSRIAPGRTGSVGLYDANGQLVKSIPYTANEFGSFAGEFELPLSGLTGNFTLRDGHGTHSFRVEEYKRPKFEVEFDPVEGEFRVNDSVTVKGKAISYAGAPISDAAVNFRIVRRPRFLNWCWWWRPMPPSESTEMSIGTVVSGPDGSFEIRFKAMPDPKIDKELKPAFTYEVIADVVDLTGETQRAQVNVQAGYVAVELYSTADEYELSRPDYILPIKAVNLNGSDVNLKGKIEILPLIPPGRVLRDRTWEAPTKRLMSKGDFEKMFPFEAWDKEDDYHAWERGTAVWTGDFDTKKTDSITIAGSDRWKSGMYVIVMTARDPFGEDIRSEQFITWYEKESKVDPRNEAFTFIPVKYVCEPGEEAEFVLGTSLDSLWVVMDLKKRDQKVERKHILLTKGMHRFTLPVEEADRGNFQFHLTTFALGRSYMFDQSVSVPWTNKQLKVTLETFRDKMQPGSKEQWKVKITGPKGEMVSAELLAGMYDQSLDALYGHSWGMSLWPYSYHRFDWRIANVYGTTYFQYLSKMSFNAGSMNYQYYDRFNFFGARGVDFGGYSEDSRYVTRSAVYGGVVEQTTGSIYTEFDGDEELEMAEEAPMMDVAGNSATDDMGADEDRSVVDGFLATKGEGESQKDKESGGEGLGKVSIRKNLQETAFFFPQLQTDEHGAVILNFTMPEALTRWRLMMLSHTKGLETGYAEQSVITQKELMVVPNPPRFLREGDVVVFNSKINNLSEKDLSGTAELELIDMATQKPVAAKFGLKATRQPFSVSKGGSISITWKLNVPEGGVQGVTWRVKAAAGDFADGEENFLPVLSNRMLVTESMPLPLRSKQKRKFRFDHLADNNSGSLRHQGFTLEFTANPAWYAVQALPYMMEFPYECTEQSFSRYYANQIATHIANSSPRIREVFEKWKNVDTDALLSNLEKNQELKNVLLEETPWVMEAQSESERKKRIGLLFDLGRMAAESDRALRKVLEVQTPNGGFPWFKGMRDNRWITGRIVAGMGHLEALSVLDSKQENRIHRAMRKACQYVDDHIRFDYEELLRLKVDMKLNHLHPGIIFELYARSFFIDDYPVASNNKEAVEYYLGQARKYWLENSNYMQALLGMVMRRTGDLNTANDIIKSMRETAIKSEELGWYWDQDRGWYWYQASIETHATIMEFFIDMKAPVTEIDEMKLWLLKNKQTNNWETTTATADACYALLLQGTDFLSEARMPRITVGDYVVDPETDTKIHTEAGTGYFKHRWDGEDVSKKMADITVENRNNAPAWGAVYWQYFEHLDKIEGAETPLKVQKELYRIDNAPEGPKAVPIAAGAKLKPGDEVRVRLVVRTDRDMEYVHLKDMRGAGFEPMQVLSGYRWQGGLGYYQSTKDASTNFFFDYLPKGTYTLEYPIRATHKGDYSNGITTIQCMYAPEFSAHTSGFRVQIQ